MTLQAGKMYRPSDVAFGGNGVIFVAEQFNHRVSKWIYSQPSYTFSIDAGQVTGINIGMAGSGYQVNDIITFSAPTIDIANPVTAIAEVASIGGGGEIQTTNILEAGNGYDPNNLPTVTADESTGSGAMLTATVSDPWGSNEDGTTGIGAPIGDGTITDTALYRPTGIAFDSLNSRLYVTDTFHNRVRVINSGDGEFVSSFGTGGFDTDEFYRPAGIAIETSSNLFIVIADELNHRAVRYATNGGAPINPLVLPDPSATMVVTDLSFVRPHGVVYDVTADEFNVSDSLRGRISSYSVVGVFQGQYGTPGSTDNNVNLFYPGSGEGLLSGGATTVFADTRNNALKTMNNEAIALTTADGSTPNAGTEGTGDGQLYWPESASAFVDTVNYVLAANTYNNRVETFSSAVAVLTAESPFNFGSP